MLLFVLLLANAVPLVVPFALSVLGGCLALANVSACTKANGIAWRESFGSVNQRMLL